MVAMAGNYIQIHFAWKRSINRIELAKFNQIEGGWTVKELARAFGAHLQEQSTE
jgi:hypothetical protein